MRFYGIGRNIVYPKIKDVHKFGCYRLSTSSILIFRLQNEGSHVGGEYGVGLDC